MRTVKVGADTLLVDNKNYTFSVAPPPENEARKRLLAATQAHAAQKKSTPAHSEQKIATQRSKASRTSLVLPVMDTAHRSV